MFHSTWKWRHFELWIRMKRFPRKFSIELTFFTSFFSSQIAKFGFTTNFCAFRGWKTFFFLLISRHFTKTRKRLNRSNMDGGTWWHRDMQNPHKRLEWKRKSIKSFLESWRKMALESIPWWEALKIITNSLFYVIRRWKLGHCRKTVHQQFRQLS